MNTFFDGVIIAYKIYDIHLTHNIFKFLTKNIEISVKLSHEGNNRFLHPYTCRNKKISVIMVIVVTKCHWEKDNTCHFVLL